MNRSIVTKPFNADGSQVEVVVETYGNGAVVEYPKPSPRIVLTADKSQIIADGVDAATVTAAFESCDLEGNDLVWTRVIPVDTVTFNVNLRLSLVAVDAAGWAVLTLSKTTPGLYRISASLPGYIDAYAAVEAIP